MNVVVAADAVADDEAALPPAAFEAAVPVLVRNYGPVKRFKIWLSEVEALFSTIAFHCCA